MNEKTLRSILDSRYRWVIVTVGTFVVGLVLVLPLVDVYRSERNEKVALLAELSAARQIAENLEKYESRVADKTAKLEKLEARTVSAESLPLLRNKLVELARETGCSLRRLNVQTPTTRPWKQGDSPIDVPGQSVSQTSSVATGYTLETWPINVSLSGNDASLRSLLERMEADGMLMHTKHFEMHPSSAGGKMLDVDMELWYFNLARN
jgi:hypothetical protein